MTKLTPVSITVFEGTAVSGIATLPTGASSCLVLAHGAGAGMNHPFIAAVCEGLAVRRIATLRYQFPYMEQGSRRPDPPKVCHQTVRAAVAAAHGLMPKLPLFAGGKSFGGRMSSQAQAIAPLSQVRGLCFFGFPLHAPKQPATTRADHLSSISIPMLFLQGSRDALADLTLMRRVTDGLHVPVTLKVIDDADHSFHVLARSGSTDSAALSAMLDEVSTWTASILKP
jgi:predicted alpha/beta-hydrolase family hydrolase